MLSCAAALVSLFAMLPGSTSERYADRIIVEKAKRRLILVSGAGVLKEYRIALGTEPTGAKQCQGDNRTPEGTVLILRQQDASVAKGLFYYFTIVRPIRALADRHDIVPIVPQGADYAEVTTFIG